MKRIAIAAGLIAAAALPAAAGAANDKPNGQDRDNAARECRSERGTTAAEREAFAVRYGTNDNRSNAFGKCVSSRSRDEQAERERAASNAAKTCKEQRGDTAAEHAAFRALWGGGSNAFGKCVSSTARARKAEDDKADKEAIGRRKSAAKTCDEERGETAATRTAFRTRWGTNENGRNAFGKCVSRTSRGLGPAA